VSRRPGDDKKKGASVITFGNDCNSITVTSLWLISMPFKLNGEFRKVYR